MSDKCDRGVFGVVGVFGDSVNHTEDPSEDHRFYEANNHTHSSSESPNPVQQHSQHVSSALLRDVQAQEGRADCGNRGVWGDTTFQVDSSRASHSTPSTTRRTWCFSGEEAEDRHEAVGGSSQHRQQEEGRTTGVLSSGAGTACEWQRDHSSTTEGGYGQDLPGECSRPPGSCGFWKGSIVDLRGGTAGPTILPMGQDNLEGRGTDQSPTGQVGSVADCSRSTTSRDHTGHQDAQDREGARDYCEGKSSTQEAHGQDRDRLCREHSQQQQHPNDDGGDATNDGDHEGVEGRSGGVARGPTPQEESLREELRHLQCGEPSRNIQEDSCPAQNGEDPSTEKRYQKLSEQTARNLEKQSREIVPQIFQSLLGPRKTYLVEVACTPESVLSRTVQEKAGYPEAAIRCSNWNHHDLCTGEGVKLILGVIDTYEPSHVWISTECGPFSPMQNLNQRTEKQQEELREKRQDALRQYVGASCVLHYAIQKGIHVTWEWAEKSHAWRLPMIQKIIEKYQMWVSVTHGCQVNLRDPKTQRFLRKGWKVMTTHKRLAMLLDLPCRCQKHETHAKCEGKLTSMSALYTKEYAKRVVSAIFQEMTHAMVQQELDGESQTPNDFGVGPYCMCGALKQHGRELVCGSCVEQPLVKGIPKKDDDPKMEGFKGEQAWVQTGETKTDKTGERSDEEIRKQLYRLHAATGHGNVRHMVDALQKRGAPERVVRLAKDFSCPICKEKHRVTHKHVASLEPLPPKWSAVEADGGHWIHPITGEHVEFALVIDQGSRFRAARIMCKGKHKTMNAKMFLSYLQEGWCQ